VETARGALHFRIEPAGAPSLRTSLLTRGPFGDNLGKASSRRYHMVCIPAVSLSIPGWAPAHPGLLLVLLVGLLPGGLAAQLVQGRVLDMDTDEPVASAAVELLGAEEGDRVLATVVSDEAGRFLIRAPATGTYRIRAGHIGYRSVTTGLFDLGAGAEALEVELFLGIEAIPLAPMLIVSDRLARLDLRLYNRGFYQRRQTWGREGMGFGHFLDRAAIERRNAFRVVDILRDIPGVRIESRGGRLPSEITLRSVTSIGDMGLRCSPLIFLDGVLAASGSPDVEIPGVNPGAHIDELVSVADLAGVEVYPGLTAPAEFLRGNLCGVIVLWTGGGEDIRSAPPHPGFEDGRGSFSVELRAGSGIGDFAPTAAGLHWAPAAAGGVVLDWRIVSWFSVYGGASWNAFGCERSACSGLDVTFVSRGWDLGVRGDLDMSGRPWLRLGVVRHRLATRWVEDGEKGEMDSPQGVGLEAALGFEIPIHQGFSLTPGVRLLRWSVSDAEGSRFTDPTSPRDPLQMVVLGGGVRFRF
jgi:hypothetical protein